MQIRKTGFVPTGCWDVAFSPSCCRPRRESLQAVRWGMMRVGESHADGEIAGVALVEFHNKRSSTHCGPPVELVGASAAALLCFGTTRERNAAKRWCAARRRRCPAAGCSNRHLRQPPEKRQVDCSTDKF